MEMAEKQAVYARKVTGQEGVSYQTLRDHTEGVADHIAGRSARWPFRATLELAARLHDAGKAQPKWQEEIREDVPSLPPHALVGVAMAEALYEDHPCPTQMHVRLARDVVEYVIGAHHGLLDTVVSVEGDWVSKLDRMIAEARENPALLRAEAMYREAMGEQDLSGLFARAAEEMLSFLKTEERLLAEGKIEDRKCGLVRTGLAVRMLLSAMVDGDWSDAARFDAEMHGLPPQTPPVIRWEEALAVLEERLQSFPADREIARVRREISEACRQTAAQPPGLYRLRVPTGAGKTLAVMRFALAHAAAHSMERIFYLAPFVSILEQNAGVYRDLFDPQRTGETVLEFHSGAARAASEAEWNSAEENRMRIISEAFDMPIILTTLYQFLMSLFSGDKRALRRLNRFAHAVIVIDEIQSVPIESQALFYAALNMLCTHFGATVVACSATIPEYGGRASDWQGSGKVGCGFLPRTQETALPRLHFQDPPDLASGFEGERCFDRVRYHWDPACITPEGLAARVHETLGSRPNALVVLNTKSATKQVFDRLKALSAGAYPVYHLSTSMCPAHRMEVLEAIRAYGPRDRFVLVSTSLIEAGVDLSVSAVFRSLTKLDSIVQCAGRCNRSGEFAERGDVYIVNVEEDLQRLPLIAWSRPVSKQVLLQKPTGDQESFAVDAEMVRSFFTAYFEEHEVRRRSFYICDQKCSLYDLLSREKASFFGYVETVRRHPENMRLLTQQFRAAADQYRVFEEGLQETLLVPYDEAAEALIAEICACADPHALRRWLRRAQPYTVNIFTEELQKLRDLGAISGEEQDLCILDKAFYDPWLGVVREAVHVSDLVL